jgi:hypothetical protein
MPLPDALWGDSKPFVDPRLFELICFELGAGEAEIRRGVDVATSAGPKDTGFLEPATQPGWVEENRACLNPATQLGWVAVGFAPACRTLLS